MNILTKEGFSNFLAQDGLYYHFLKKLGLTKNISLISIFLISHINQSKFIGISKSDSFQYLSIRLLSFALIFLIIARSDYSGTLHYHLEQLLLTIFYLIYFVCADYHNSRQNQLALYFDDLLND